MVVGIECLFSGVFEVLFGFWIGVELDLYLDTGNIIVGGCILCQAGYVML